MFACFYMYFVEATLVVMAQQQIMTHKRQFYEAHQWEEASNTVGPHLEGVFDCKRAETHQPGGRSNNDPSGDSTNFIQVYVPFSTVIN